MGGRARPLSAAGRGGAVRLAATLRAVERAIARRSSSPASLTLRRGKDGHAFVTDGGHWIFDAALGRIDDPSAVAHALAAIPGVMEHGLFIGLAQMAIIAGPDGIRMVERS